MKNSYFILKKSLAAAKLAWVFVILFSLNASQSWGQISEDFEGASAPAGWTFSPAGVWGTAQPCSGSRSISFTGDGQFAVTPAITNPGFLSFSKRRSTNTATWSMEVQISSSPTGPWVTVETISTITTTCQTDYVDLSAFTGTRYIRFLDTRGSGAPQRAIDDVVIQQASTPFNLSTGSYTFSGWASNVAAGRYPANGATGSNNTTGVANSVAASNMSFWVHSTADPALGTVFQDYWKCPYNITSRSRFQGEGANGVSMVNTGSSQACTSCTAGPCGGTDIQFGRAGAVVLNLNSSGRENLEVQWTGRTKAVNTRIMSIQLQYRVGESLTWNTVSGQYYERNATAGHSQSFNTTLPSACDNQPLVQVRWVYQWVSGGSGDRAQLTLDDITVSSAPLCTAPSTQASNLSFSAITATSATITWTNGNGNGRIVAINTSNSFTNPSNGDNPTANTVYGSGEQIIFNGTGNSVSVTGLAPLTNYHVRVYEFDCAGRLYNVSTATNNPNSFSTIAAATPTITLNETSNNFGNQAVSTSSSGFQYNVSGAALTANITVTAPANFEVSLNNSTWSNSVTVPQTGGNANQDVYVRFSPGSANGANSGNVTHTSAAATTQNLAVSGNALAALPTSSASNFVATNITTSSMNISVTSGNGNNRLIVAREGAAVNFTPVAATSYSANADFSAATDLGNGNKVVYNGSGNSFTLSGLSPLTTYHFAVYEYNVGTGTSQNYRTTSPLTASEITLQFLPVTWNFNGPSATDVPGGNASPLPMPGSGVGTASLIGGTTATFASGVANGGSSDPVATSPPNYAWNTTTYPAQSTGNKTAGAQFMVSTAGYENIFFSFDLRFSNTAANTWVIQYTTNGTTWTDFDVLTTNCGDCWSNNNVYDMSSITALNNNPNAGFRVVSSFAGASSSYVAANSSSSYGGGTARFDMVNVGACPAPTTHASALTSSSITTTSATLNWTSGNGSERIVVMRAASDVNANPVDNSAYTANSTFGSGSEIGTGNFVVYRGTGNSATVNGLTPGEEYFIRIFELESGCNPGIEKYLVTGTPAGTDFIARPPVPTGFNVVCSNTTTADVSWNAPAGVFDGYVLVARTATGELISLFSIDPTGANDNLDFTLAQQYGPAPNQGRILYVGNNTTATVTGLTSSSTYTYRVYTYRKIGATFVYSSSTSITQTAELNNVTNAHAAAANNGAFVSWTNPNSTCYDEVLVVGSNATITFTPTGDGSAYIPNPAYAGVNSIILKSSSLNAVNVTNLVNLDTYFFKIFVRNGTTWSSGVEVSVVPADVTVLDKGDVAIIAVNTQYLSSGTDDEICFIAFKDIKQGTSIEFTDNGYERVSAGLWGNTEGTIRITYQGATDIVAGTPICLQGSGALASNFQVQVCGVNTPANWNIVSLNGNFHQFDLNANDQVWIFQNGAWNAGTANQHNATYSGNVIWGWTATGWEAAPGFASPSGSTLVEGTECFNVNTNIANPSKVKYTGPLTAANQSEWVARIGNVANWTGYASNADYNAVAGRDYSGSCVSFTVNAGGFQAGLWTGAASTDWFSCSNWDDLKVPNNMVDVTIPNTTNKPVIGAGVAECRNITIEASSNLTMNNANSILEVYGDWFNNSGSNLSLQGNNNATVKFRNGGTQTIGGSQETYFQRLIIEDGTLVNLNRNTRVGGNGLLQVTGVGSQLGATHSVGNQRTLNIQGNTTMELVAGGSMNDNALDHLNIETGGNSSAAVFTGNGNEIKCWNFNPVKTSSNGVTLSVNTPLTCKNNFDANFAGTALFSDNGNTISVGDDLKLNGAVAGNYNFTGTMIMTGTGEGNMNTIQNGANAIVGHLNNLVINTPVGKPNVQFNPQSGSQSITIKGDLTIESGHLLVHGNTLNIGGNYNNQVGQAALSEGTSTFSFFGAATNQISCVDEEEFYNLNLDKMGSTILQIGSDIKVLNNLNFTSGILQTGSNNLLIANNAVSSITGGLTNGTNNFVEGRLIRNTNNGNYQFPIGTSAHGAQGFNINVTGAGNVLGFLESNNTNPLVDRAYCDIETTTAPESEIGQGTSGPDGFLDRMIFDLSSPLQWNVTNPGGGISQYDITVDANGSNNISPVIAANGTPIRFLLKNGEPGNTGVATGNVPDEFDETGFLACPNGYTLTGMTSFSTFTINGSTGPSTQLPIELLYFNALPKNGMVELTWATATELNNDFFTVERTVDGLNWEVVLNTPGAGTTTQQTNYIQFDTRPLSGVSYYRLKQTDFDGQFSYSNIVSVVIDTEDKQLIKAVNVLGQEVDQNAKGMVILIFSNGESLKIVNE